MNPPSLQVSVIVPTYNRCDMIGRTLASILRQTHAPAEIIVIDDGSTDDVRSVVAGFPVRYHRIANSGPNIARAVALTLVRSPWTAFCDDDDEWMPDYLESWASLLAAGGVYGFGNFRSIVGGRLTTEDKFGEAPPGYFSAPERPFYPKIVRFNAVWPSCVIARTDFLSSIGGFDTRLPRAATEDLEFTLRCNQSVAPVIQYRPLVGIRRHGGNLTADKLRVCLWDVEALIWARDHHAVAAQYADIFAAEIARRRRLALEIAFTLGDTRSVRALASLLGSEIVSPKLLVKTLLCQSRLVPGSALRALFGPGTRRAVS